MKHIIRHYKDEDLPDVLSVWEGASRVSHPFLSNDFFEKERYNIPNLYLPNADVWVVERNEKIIGFIALVSNKVCAVFVKPEFQGAGAGRTLMDKARELHGNLEVDVFKDNLIGCKFYSSYGFKSSGKKTHEETGHQVLI